MKRWEIGSDFDWSEDILLSSPSSFWLPDRYQLFSTATAGLLAFKSLFQQRSAKPIRIHIPSFYCMSVVSKLQTVFEVCWYRDLPHESTPDFDTLKALPGDLVIAVNLFGIKPQQPWQDWQQQNPNTVLIEDHTHDPFSLWAKNSKAHYGISSLHKTLPIPDGAILWSPRNLDLPQPWGKESPGASQRLMGAILKRAYLMGLAVNKEDYLSLSREGQNQLDDPTNSIISVFTANILKFLDVENFRAKRADNIRKFTDLCKNKPNPDWELLFDRWNRDTTPFNGILLCESQQLRDALRQYLIDRHIFGSIHWQQPYEGVSSQDTKAIALSEKVLTIPLDWRYDQPDIVRIVEIINDFK